MRPVTKAALGVGGALAGAALWWRVNPSPCPYGQRFWIEAPHPLITRARLHEALEPRPGQTVLEVGPGTGYYSISVAEALGPDGTLHLYDVQQPMLDHTTAQARRAGVENVTARQGDAQDLPYGDATFDAAFLVTVLGEIPDQERALAELRRVVKPDGRVVVGELIGDPHMVTSKRLAARAAGAGLRLRRRIGPRLGYFAVLEPAA